MALISPAAIALGVFLSSGSPDAPFFPPTNPLNAVALLLMIMSPAALFASLVLGVRQMLDPHRSGIGWLAAGLVLDFCWILLICIAVLARILRGH